MSDDEIGKNDKFDNMIKAIKRRDALPKYSVVLWEVLTKILEKSYKSYIGWKAPAMEEEDSHEMGIKS